MGPVGQIPGFNPFVKSAGLVGGRSGGSTQAVGGAQNPEQGGGLVDRLNAMGNGELKPAVTGSHLGKNLDFAA